MYARTNALLVIFVQVISATIIEDAYPPFLTIHPGDGDIVNLGYNSSCDTRANPPATEVTISLKNGGVWEEKARGVTRADFAPREVGDFQMKCAAKNAEGSTEKEYSLRVRSWKIETPKGKELSVHTGGSFEFSCKLTFHPTEEHDPRKIAVLWLHDRPDLYNDTLLAISRSDHGDKTYSRRVKVTYHRASNQITTSMTFSNATVQRETHRMAVGCFFRNTQTGNVLRNDMVANILFKTKVVGVPTGRDLRVKTESNFTLKCKFTFDPNKVDSSQVQLQWTSNNTLLYGTTGTGYKVDRVTVIVTRATHYVSSSLKYLNASIERDSNTMLIGCHFNQSNLNLSLKKQTRIYLQYVTEIEASSDLEVDHGSNFTVTCSAKFDPREVTVRYVNVEWIDHTHNYPLYESKLGGALSSRVIVTFTRGAYYARSSMTFTEAMVVRDSSRLVIECGFKDIPSNALSLKKNITINIMYRWHIEIFNSFQREPNVISGQNIQLACTLTFDRSQLHSSQIRVKWRYRKSSVTEFTNLESAHVSRREDRAHSSLTFPTKEQHHTEDLIFECEFFQRGDIYSQKKDITITVKAAILSEICGRRSLLPTHPEYRIMGGRDAQPGEAPWHVYFRLVLPLTTKKSKVQCSGTIIHQRWILTAAHCFDRRKIKNLRLHFMRVIAGNVDLKNDKKAPDEGSHTQILWIKRVIKHEAYNRALLKNDIALLELHSPVRFTNFTYPICLPKEEDDFTGQLCTASGFGVSKAGNIITDMKNVDLPIMKWTRCESWKMKKYAYKDYVTRENICTLYPGVRSTCPRSCSGPLVCLNSKDQFIQAGILSWGATCAERPAVYLKVAAFLPWIKRKMNITDY